MKGFIKMATTKKKTTSSTKTSTERTPKQIYEPVNEIPDTKPLKISEVDLNQYITVRNGFQGRLTYKSERTGETFKWDDFGAEQEIELRELRNAKSSHKKYFTNNWFMFDEDWVIDYLGVNQYYKNALKIDEFDTIFNLSANELQKRLNSLSDGQKKSVAYRAKELIASEAIDSRKIIAVLEETLGVELIEK